MQIRFGKIMGVLGVLTIPWLTEAPALAAMKADAPHVFRNPDCARTQSCALKEFKVEVLRETMRDSSNMLSSGAHMVASYQTKDLSRIRDFVVVQFIRGCIYGSSKDAVGDINSYYGTSRAYFGTKDGNYTFHHPEWVVDSVDLDPAYGSNSLGRHSGYLNVRPDPAGNGEYYRADFYHNGDPKVSRLYTMDSPSHSFVMPSSEETEIFPTNSSLEFRTCIFKSSDVPVRVRPDWTGDGKALNCHTWLASSVYDWQKKKLVPTASVDPFCLQPRTAAEAEEDRRVLEKIKEPAPAGYLNPPPRGAEQGFRQTQIKTIGISVEPLPESAFRQALDQRFFGSLKASRYEPRFPAGARLDREIDLSVVIESGTLWDSEQRMSVQLRKVAEIFSQCGLRVRGADVVTAPFSAEARALLGPNPDLYKTPPKAEVLRGANLPRPIAFLFGDEDPDAIFAINEDSAAAMKTLEPMLNSIWITQGALTKYNRTDEKAGFNVLAHELAHVVGNLGHVMWKDKNLMNSADTRNTKSGDFSPGQCEAIRTWAAANK